MMEKRGNFKTWIIYVYPGSFLYPRFEKLSKKKNIGPSHSIFYHFYPAFERYDIRDFGFVDDFNSILSLQYT